MFDNWKIDKWSRDRKDGERHPAWAGLTGFERRLDMGYREKDNQKSCQEDGALINREEEADVSGWGQAEFVVLVGHLGRDIPLAVG